VFPKVLRHQIRFVDFGVLVTMLPLGVQTIDQLKCPFEICSRGAAPNSYGMVLVRYSIDSMHTRFQHMHGRTQHLHGFQQDFTYVFVYHRLGNLLLDERKYEEVHGLH
jgi:hypothetical protein